MNGIGVFSTIELYLTAFGWNMYGSMWRLLTLSGLAWWPFLYAIYINTREPSESQEPRAASVVSLRRMQWEMLIMCFICAMAVVPWVTLPANRLTYRCPATALTAGMACAASGGASIGGTGSTYDQYSQGSWGTTMQVPVLWAAVMSLSGGINQAAITMMPSQGDLAGMQTMMRSSRISDPQVAAEMKRFTRECYMPAANKLERILKGEMSYGYTGLVTQLRAAMSEGNLKGATGIDWPGSPVFNNPGLYIQCPDPDMCGESLRATKPVKNWPYSQFRDTEDAYANNNAAGLPGRPFCNEWWSGSSGVAGLRDAVVNDAARGIQGGQMAATDPFMFTPSSYAEQLLPKLQAVVNASADRAFGTTVPGSWGDAVENEMVYQAYSSIKAPSLVEMDPVYAQTGDGAVTSRVKNLLGTVGAGWENFTMSMKLPMIMQGAPMVQSALIMLLLVSLPFVMVLGRYSVESFIVCAVGYVTLRFWTVLWAFATWTHQTMTEVMASQASTTGFANAATGPMYLGVLVNNASTGESGAEYLISIVTMGLFTAVPVIFSVFMSWVGFRGVSALSGGFEGLMNKGVNQAAQRTSDTGQAVIHAGATVASGGAGAAAGAAVGGGIAGGMASGAIRGTTGALIPRN